MQMALMKSARLPLLLALSRAACADQSTPPVIVHVVSEAGACRLELDGRPVTQDQLLGAAHSWRRRVVRVEYGMNTSYKCIGGTLFTVQRAGVKKVGIAPLPNE